ncbi:MAG: (2Fe-2S)-binding protein [Chloroflexota bacterium]|nr:(2Fe-2S)-binding protein [Chloroflexota bacterium]
MPEVMQTRKIAIAVTVNGTQYEALVEPRRLLADFLREDLGFTGTHLGCEHGVCGACTVLLDGETVRSCLLFAVQASGRTVMTVEGLAEDNGSLHPIQVAFWEEHGLQCGFCTPGFLMTTYELLQANAKPTEDEIRAAISGNLCRCTGYQNIVRSVQSAAEKMAAAVGAPVVSA